MYRPNSVLYRRLTSTLRGHLIKGHYSVAIVNNCRQQLCKPCSCFVNRIKIRSTSTSNLNADPLSSMLAYPSTSSDYSEYFRRIAHLFKLEKINSEVLEKSKTFQDVCEDLRYSLIDCFSDNQYQIVELLNLIDCCEKFGFSDKHPLVKDLERTLFLSLPSASFKALIICAKFFMHRNLESSIRKQTFTDVQFSIEKRVEQVVELSEFVAYYKLLDKKMAPTIFKAMDDRIIQFCQDEKFIKNENAEYFLKILIILLEQKRRPTPVLKAVFTTLKKLDFTGYPHLLHLLNAINALNSFAFPDSELLEKIGNEVTRQSCWTENTKPSQVSAIFLAMAKMNWRFEPMLQQFVEDLKRRNFHGTHQIINFVVAAARLDYKPENFNIILKNTILTDVKQESLKNDSSVWLDFVYSLLILGVKIPEHISSVLDSSFLTQLRPQGEYSKYKLLHIKHAADTLELKYDTNIDLSQFNPPIVSPSSIQQKEFIVDHIRNFVIRDKFVSSSFQSPLGGIIGKTSISYFDDNVLIETRLIYFLDTEVIIDQNLQALPIEEYGTHLEQKKQLPEEFKRYHCNATEQKY